MTASWLVISGDDAPGYQGRFRSSELVAPHVLLVGSPSRKWTTPEGALNIVDGFCLDQSGKPLPMTRDIAPEQGGYGNFVAVSVDFVRGSLTAWSDGGESRNLFYMTTPRAVFVSNDLSLMAEAFPVKPDFGTLFGFIRYGYINVSRRTFFSGISKLKAFEKLTASFSGSPKLDVSYWHVPVIGEAILSHDDALEQTRQILTAALKGAISATGTSVLTLTSGVDSNLLYYLLQGSAIAPSTVTHVFDHAEYDEYRLIAESRGIDETNFKVTIYDDCLQRVSDAIEVARQPINGLNSLGAVCTNRFVADFGAKAVITGTGDDIFFSITKDKAQEFSAASGRAFSGEGKPLAPSTYMSSDFLDLMKDWQPEFHAPPIERRNRDLVKATMAENFFIFKSPHIAADFAACAVENELDVISPFLDKSVIDFVFGLSEASLHWDNTPKTLPTVLLNRIHGGTFPKGIKMNTPQRELLRGIYRPAIEELIHDSKLADDGLIDARQLSMQYREYLAQAELGNSYFLWKFVVSEIWYRLYFYGQRRNLWPAYAG